MNRLTIAFTLLLLSFMMPTSASAKNLKIEEISSHLEAIQVGAFKERKNILQQNRLFSHYNTFIEYGEKFSRFYIVNIKKEDYEHILSEVKKSNPSAFLASKKIRKLIKSHRPVDTFVREIKPDKKNHHDNRSLNSDTILKTRKKFF